MDNFNDIWQQPSISMLPASVWKPIVLTILWKIWDAGNALIFRNKTISVSNIICNATSDRSLWMYWFKYPNQKEPALPCLGVTIFPHVSL
jgi:hypothetical protein